MNILQEASIKHKASVREKNRLIKEAESIKNAFNGLSWDEMDSHQKKCYECAMQRLKLLLSFGKDAAPSYIPGLQQWPHGYRKYLG